MGFTVTVVIPTVGRTSLGKSIRSALDQTVSVERIRDEIFKMMKHDTITSIRLLTNVDKELIPGFFELVFSKGLWLKPTFEQ
jgi:tRNA nucleotidyltransferase/poly(A) polymerase